MSSSAMLRLVVLVRTDVSEESSASIIRVTRIGELRTTLAVTSNRRTLRRNAKSYKDKYFVFLRSLRRLLVTANVVASSPILVSLMMEVICSTETSVLTRTTSRNIPDDGISLLTFNGMRVVTSQRLHLLPSRLFQFTSHTPLSGSSPLSGSTSLSGSSPQCPVN
jgi:hypothetical protein